MTTEQATNALRAYAEQLRELERKHTQRVEDAADAEAVYRKSLAARYTEHRKGGASVAESELRARADVVKLSRERDVAAGLLRGVLEELENRRGERNAFQSLMRMTEHAVKP